MPAARMPLPGIKPLTAAQQLATSRGQSATQAVRSTGPKATPVRLTSTPIVKAPAPIVKAPAPVVKQPTFNLPNPVQAQPMQPPAGSFFQPPVTAQNPVGGFQTPPPAPTPPVDTGNFGTIQSQPAPISGVAMPTPNPVPPAPTPPVSPGNFGVIQSQPAPISDVAMPTPNPVPPAPAPVTGTGYMGGDLSFGAPMQGPTTGTNWNQYNPALNISNDQTNIQGTLLGLDAQNNPVYQGSQGGGNSGAGSLSGARLMGLFDQNGSRLGNGLTLPGQQVGQGLINQYYNPSSTTGGMNALPGLGGPQLVGGPAAPFGGPPQMSYQDWINQGATPEQAQQYMSQGGPQ